MTDPTFFSRKKRRMAQIVLQSLVPFSVGLTVATGDYISSENRISAWVAMNPGTSADPAPTGTGIQVDGGGISWGKVDTALLARFVNNAPPQPT
jgi:hypothetical protein